MLEIIPGIHNPIQRSKISFSDVQYGTETVAIAWCALAERLKVGH